MKRLLIVLLLIGVASACVWLVGHQPERGFLLRTYTAPDGSTHKYTVFVPFDVDQQEQPPVILYLNGFGKNGSDGLLPLRDGLAPAIWETKDTFPFIVVFPQCNKGSSWQADGPDAQRALAILEEAAQEYGTSLDCVSLTGLSSGGLGVWLIASDSPERFSSITPMSAVSVSESLLAPIEEAGMPVWMFYVKDDPLVPEESRETVRQHLVRAGLGPRETIVDGTAHMSWDIAYRMPAFYTWLLDQSRRENSQTKRGFQPLLTNGSLKGWSQIGGGEWSLDSDGVITSQRTSAGEAASLVTDETYSDVEFHVEFKLIGTQACSLAFRTNQQSDSSDGWTFVAVSSELGSGGLSDNATGKWLAPTDVLAQRAMRSDGWNDCRVRIEGSRVEVELNGWKAIDYESDQLPQQGMFALSAPDQTDAQILWRSAACRPLEN